jgi:hypothetical protein
MKLEVVFNFAYLSYRQVSSLRGGSVDDTETGSQAWLPVIARSLAYIALTAAKMDDKTTAERARFLEGLGLGRKEVAAMLGTTYASVTELLRQARNRRSGRRGSGKKKR